MIEIKDSNITPKRIWKVFAHVIRLYYKRGYDYDIFCQFIAKNLEEHFNIDYDYTMLYYALPCMKIYI